MDDSAASTLALPGPAAARRGFARKLLGWFRRSARDLPWRRTRDLYAIWISEIMLQQTQVQTVVPYYHRFLAEFPDVAALAAADEQQVLRLWEGLGYYRRARQLHRAARQVVADHGGRFPTTYLAVRGLPGIGRYTAGAILSIGLDARLPILEANTIRVLSRLSGYRGEPSASAGQKRLWSLAEAILPAKEAGAFNQALMELGSEICTPKAPACGQCPVAAHCAAHAQGIVEMVPAAARRTNYEEVTEIAAVVDRGGRVLLRKCQPGQRWAGLWDFPRYSGNYRELAERVAELTGAAVVPGALLTTLKHGVTRFRITLECYEAACVASKTLNGGHRKQGANGSSPASEMPASEMPASEIRWVTLDELGELPLSVTGRKIAALLQERRGRRGQTAVASPKTGVTRRTSPYVAVRPRRSRKTPG